jgi:RNA polymerase-interacting CarD/CdnL/TRCF family regulator
VLPSAVLWVLDGRRQYGWGSKIKDRIRKIIPNEVAKVAEVAAPFVAPFNPLAAGLMSGIGGFDRTGKIGSSIKSGLMNYGMGQLARGIGGGMDNLQGASLRTMPGQTGFGSYFSSPIQNSGGLGKLLQGTADKTFATSGGSMDAYAGMGDPMSTGMDLVKKPGFIESIGNKISGLIPESTLGKIALGGGAVALGTALLGGGPEETVSAIMDRGEGLDIEGIRAEVTEAFKDSTGEKLLALRSKYPYLGTQASKNTAIMAMGGRIGFNRGGGADMGAPQMGGLQTFMKSNSGTDYVKTVMESLYQQNQNKYQSPDNPQLVQDALMVVQESMAPFKLSESRMKNNLSRINRAEGGIMDLGGMEKDYRAEGGFVPIGAKEKADDVPARLSVNEFVFTADAVRGAGQGDIDKGAEIMENMMRHLEQGGQVSEESQGMAGARDMFATSQRLGEVI